MLPGAVVSVRPIRNTVATDEWRERAERVSIGENVEGEKTSAFY